MPNSHIVKDADLTVTVFYFCFVSVFFFVRCCNKWRLNWHLAHNIPKKKKIFCIDFMMATRNIFEMQSKPVDRQIFHTKKIWIVHINDCRWRCKMPLEHVKFRIQIYCAILKQRNKKTNHILFVKLLYRPSFYRWIEHCYPLPWTANRPPDKYLW